MREAEQMHEHVKMLPQRLRRLDNPEICRNVLPNSRLRIGSDEVQVLRLRPFIGWRGAVHEGVNGALHNEANAAHCSTWILHCHSAQQQSIRQLGAPEVTPSISVSVPHRLMRSSSVVCELT